jgi:hypothetical protein
MAKKSKKKASTRSAKSGPQKDVAVSKQAVGGITGAVLGAMVGGPMGAIAGGVAGAMVGDSSGKGRRPVEKTVETITGEIRKGTPQKAIASVTGMTSSLGRKKKKSTKRPAASSAKSVKSKKTTKKKAAKSAKKAKTKTAKKKRTGTKKRAKKKR